MKKIKFFKTTLPEDWYVVTPKEDYYTVAKYCPDTGASFAEEVVDSGIQLKRKVYEIKSLALEEAMKLANIEGSKHSVVVNDIDGELMIRSTTDRVKASDRFIDVFNPGDYRERLDMLSKLTDILSERIDEEWN